MVNSLNFNFFNLLADNANTIQELSSGNAGTCKSFHYTRSPAFLIKVKKKCGKKKWKKMSGSVRNKAAFLYLSVSYDT